MEICEWKILGDVVNNKNKKEKKESSVVDLREYLLSFVKKPFIPNMQAEAYYQMGQILFDNQPMDAIKLQNNCNTKIMM